jgi:hypothetical protein
MEKNLLMTLSDIKNMQGLIIFKWKINQLYHQSSANKICIVLNAIKDMVYKLTDLNVVLVVQGVSYVKTQKIFLVLLQIQKNFFKE